MQQPQPSTRPRYPPPLEQYGASQGEDIWDAYWSAVISGGVELWHRLPQCGVRDVLLAFTLTRGLPRRAYFPGVGISAVPFALAALGFTCTTADISSASVSFLNSSPAGERYVDAYLGELIAEASARRGESPPPVDLKGGTCLRERMPPASGTLHVQKADLRSGCGRIYEQSIVVCHCFLDYLAAADRATFLKSLYSCVAAGGVLAIRTEMSREHDEFGHDRRQLEEEITSVGFEVYLREFWAKVAANTPDASGRMSISRLLRRSRAQSEDQLLDLAEYEHSRQAARLTEGSKLAIILPVPRLFAHADLFSNQTLELAHRE